MPELAQKVLARLTRERAEQEAQKQGVSPESILVPLEGKEAPPPLVLTPDPGLLDLPMAKLTRPLPVWSALLGELIYLVPTEADAQRLLAEGQAAYFPEEVAIFLEIKARWPATWWEKGQNIHLAKKAFGGLVTELLIITD